MPITLDQAATVAHMNVRKEGPDSDKHLMVDLKMQVKTDAGILAEFDPTLPFLLFYDGECRYPKMAPIKWEGEMKYMELDIAGIHLMDVKVHKFQITPFSINGQPFVDLSLTATFAPDGRETAILAEQVGEEIAIKLNPGPQLDLGGKVELAARALNDSLRANGDTAEIIGPDGKSYGKYGAIEAGKTPFSP
jgi:hypothetical protein